jgi:hypothetical protein
VVKQRGQSQIQQTAERLSIFPLSSRYSSIGGDGRRFANERFPRELLTKRHDTFLISAAFSSSKKQINGFRNGIAA